MHLRKLFPCIIVAFFTIELASSPVIAQTSETRQRKVVETGELINRDERQLLQNEPANDPPSSLNDMKPRRIFAPDRTFNVSRVERLISLAIDERLGARYSWGATGPFAFDCSGFVWSTFRSAGINFERGSARTLWVRFLPADPEDEFDFGTLVFFSGLTHVGIVADEDGFYHASRQHGVVYSRFNDYWLSRIDGFRRVPGADLQTGE